MAIPQVPCYTDPVSNLTLSIDDEVLKKARIRAIEQGTSVNAVVRGYLESYAGIGEQRAALTDFVALATNSDSGSAGSRRAWTREGLYKDRG